MDFGTVVPSKKVVSVKVNWENKFIELTIEKKSAIETFQ
jgi:hypothetical protein